MRTTKRHRELIADLATERTRLRESQMVWIGGAATADKAGLLNHMPDMTAVTNAARFGEDKQSFTYLCCRAGLLGQGLLGECVITLCILCL